MPEENTMSLKDLLIRKDMVYVGGGCFILKGSGRAKGTLKDPATFINVK